MNINQLRYFVAAVDHGSFSAAGSALFVTSQAVSKAVSEMERETGIKMLERAGSGVRPTEFGRLFYEKATDIVHAFAEIESLPADYAVTGDIAGTMSLALTIPFFRGSVPIQSDFDAFLSAHPDVDLHVFVNTSNACRLALEEGTVDAAIILGRSDNPDFACYKISETQPHVLVSADHPLAHRTNVSLRDLAGVPILSPSDLSYFYKTLLARCRTYGFEPKFVTVPPILDEFRLFLGQHGGAMFVTKDAELAKLYPDTVCIPLAPCDAFAIPICLLCKHEAKTPLFFALKDFLLDRAHAFYEGETGRG